MNDDLLTRAALEFPRDKYADLQTVCVQRKQIDGDMTQQLAVTFGVKQKKDKHQIPADQLLPDTLHVDGHDIPTDVVEDNIEWDFEPAGCPFNDESTVNQHKQHVRPLTGGVSIGIGTNEHRYKVGTLGMLLVDTTDGQVVGLTNNHVLVPGLYTIASEQTDSKNYRDVEVFQPARGESGGARIEDHVIGHVKRVYPVRTSSSNEIDAGLIAIHSTVELDNTSGGLLNHHDNNTPPQPIGSIVVATTQEIDSLLRDSIPLFKSSRTTGAFGSNLPLEQAAEQSQCSLQVQSMGYTPRVSGHPFHNIMRYQDPNIMNRIDPSTGGDSGSVICGWLNGQWKAVGLHFAGSRTAGVDQGLMCRMDRVMELLQLSDFDPDNITAGQTGPEYRVISGYSDDIRITIDGKTYWQIGRTTDNVNTERLPDTFPTFRTTDL